MKVVVLMSTYNGAAYLDQQVRSILEQLPADGLLMVRDDGSTDGTVACLERWQDPRVTVSAEANIGFGASFLTLLARLPKHAELVMFSDQDDVWLPGKIDRARAALAPLGESPGLYCSGQWLVDAELAPLGKSPRWARGPSFSGALAENLVTGCTAALNRAAARILQQAGVPTTVRFHDWWIYLVISAFGTVVVDEDATLLYRQHAGNAIGRREGWWQRHLQIVRFLRRNDWVGLLLGQVQSLWTHYRDELPAEHRDLVQRYFCPDGSAPRLRWRLVFSLRLWRQSLDQELLFRGLLALHRLGWWPRAGRRS